MEDISIVPTWKYLWDTWHLRGFIILSLLLQTFLIILAPLRKRTSSNWIITPLWFFYLLADWVANFAIGLITKGQGDPCTLSSNTGGSYVIAVDKDLLAFWAPFLLLHLGGPDTITAFALEDNEFWLRHLLGLVFQFSATLYVFFQSVTRNNTLLAPTMLMIIGGTIKYTERTVAFYLASANKFKCSVLANVAPGFNYISLMEDHHIEKKMFHSKGRKAERDAEKSDLTERQVVRFAHYFFNRFKGLAVDQIFREETRSISRSVLLLQTAKDAFKVVEVELNLFYEAFFTKLPVVYGFYGIGTRIFSIVIVCTSTALFKIEDKSKFNNNIDVNLTYALLIGALVVDIIAIFMLMLSNKTILFLLEKSTRGDHFLLTRILYKILTCNVSGNLKRPEEAATQENEPHTHVSFFKRRWSESIPTYNLIYYSIHPRSKYKQLIYDKLGLTNFLDSYTYVKAKRFTPKLRDFIFEELKLKSEHFGDLDSAMDISSSRGDRVLRIDDVWSRLLPYTLDNDFGQRILLWHIATDLCYSKDISDKSKSKRHVNTTTDYREIAKILSDYMMYILIMKPTLLTTITSITQLHFWDLCSSVKSNVMNEKAHEVVKRQGTKESEVDWEHINACMKIISHEPKLRKRGDANPINHFYDYCISLANEVLKIEEEYDALDKWLIISKVWVDLLCYGASHSQAKMQTAQVSKGGDLITIVWLLMANLGLGDQFQIDLHERAIEAL